MGRADSRMYGGLALKDGHKMKTVYSAPPQELGFPGSQPFMFLKFYRHETPNPSSESANIDHQFLCGICKNCDCLYSQHFDPTRLLQVAEQEGLPAPREGKMSVVRPSVQGNSVTNLGPFHHIANQQKDWRAEDASRIYLGECAPFVQKLAQICEEKYGVTFLYGTRISSLETATRTTTTTTEEEEVAAVILADGKKLTEFDKYVIAMGAASVPLLRAAGINLPLYSARGYALQVDDVPEHLQPNATCRVISWPGFFVMSFFGERRIRLTSFLEFIRPGAQVLPNKERERLLRETAKRLLTDPDSSAPEVLYQIFLIH